eukprot:9238796-Heterocapsa_arctica.AAC.1
MVQTYDYDNGDKQNKRTITVFWCNIPKWGALSHHYDLLHPIEEKKRKEKQTKHKLIDNHEAEMLKRNIEANQIELEW